MRISIVLLVISTLSLNATSSYSQETKMSLKLKNASIFDLLNEIGKKSEFSFWYNMNEISDKARITISIQNMTIDKILALVLKDQNLAYEIKDKVIVVYKPSENKDREISSLQQHKITGTVTDSYTGEPIPGVNIVVEGTTNGVVSDINGKYSIAVVSENAVLTFSFIGYLTERLSVAGQSTIDMKMVPEIKSLDEVVVIGYGTVKRADLTGAVASVKGDELSTVPVPDVAQALQGKLAGVAVSAQDGRPGASMSIRIRGGGSVTQSNDPLFVVDGIPVSSISDIPASQIKSIDVLKDASSTAIYGASGANGVILVTTFSPEKGNSFISFDSYMQIKNVAKKLDVLNSQDYVLNTWSYATAQGTSYKNGVEGYFGLGSSNGNHYAEYANMPVHNYTNDLLQTVIAQSYNLSLNGAGEKTSYLFMLNYMNDPGIKINSSYDRINATLKIDHQLFEKFKVGFNVRFTQTNRKGNESNTILSKAFMYKPIDNPLGNGDYSGFGNGDTNIDDAYNPVDVTNSSKNRNKSNNINGLMTIQWKLFKGFTVNNDFSISGSWGTSKSYNNGLTSASSYKYASLTNSDGYSLRNALTLNYQVQGLSNKHNLSFLIGNENFYTVSNSCNIYGTGYASSFDFDRAFGMINMTDGTKDSFSNTEGTPETTQSYFGRANYSFLDRYLFTVTSRMDGSSKFAKNNRWGFFPAAAFAWRVIDEPFMEPSKRWLNNLKLRLSYGTSGSDNISSKLWDETWTSGTIIYDDQTLTTYATSGLLANPDLKWETTISRNIGVDFGFFNNKLSGSMDFYKNTTKDLLIKVPIDASTGYSFQYQNVGSTSNKGIELALNYDIYRTKNFDLNVSATYSYNINNIDDLDDELSTKYRTGWASNSLRPTYDYEFKEGEPVGVVRGFINDGFYSVNDFNVTQSNGKYVYSLKDGVADISSDFIGRYYGQSNFTTDGCFAFPGAIKLRDFDKSGKVDDNDVTDLGEITPKHTGGFNINITYKNFDFNAGFTYAIGGHVYNALAMSNMYGNVDNSIGANRLKFVKDCYKIYDVDGSGNLQAITDPDALNKLNANAKYALPYYERGLVLSNWFEDASYLRLNTLTIGYSLPQSMLKKLRLKNLHVYATGGNLFVLTKYSGLDPEVNSYGNYGGFPTLGLDYYTYPRSRTFTFGLKLTL
jgi:TonB-linked SusC/RagA family outer membrane protein